MSAHRFELPKVSACAYTNNDNGPLTGTTLFDIDLTTGTATAPGKIGGSWPLTALGQLAE